MPKGGGGYNSPQSQQAERLAGIQGDMAQQLFKETGPLRGSLFGSPGTPATSVMRRVPITGSDGGFTGMVTPPPSLLSYGLGDYAPDAEGIWRPTGRSVELQPGGFGTGGGGGDGGGFRDVEEWTPGTPGTPGILQAMLGETAPPAIRLPPAVQIPPEIVTPQERETIEGQYGTAGTRLLSQGVRGGALGASLTNLETARARDITGLESARAVSDRARRLQQSFLDREMNIQQQELDRGALLETSGMRRGAVATALGGTGQAIGLGQAGISSAGGTNLALADLAAKERAQTLGLIGQAGQTAGLAYGLRGSGAGAGAGAGKKAAAPGVGVGMEAGSTGIMEAAMMAAAL